MSRVMDHREYVYSVAVNKKHLTRLGELIIVESWGEKLSILPTELDTFFLYTAKLYTYSIYLSTSDLSSFIISNTDKYKFSSTWKWISCCNDVMNHIDCVIKRDVYPQKMHSCFKNIRGISFFVKKYLWYIYIKNIMCDIAWIFA